MASMLERYLGRPIRSTSWWMWIFLLPVVLWAWPVVLIYIIVRLVIDMMKYDPSETMLSDLVTALDDNSAQTATTEASSPLGPVDDDRNRPASGWWDLDSIPVGVDHNRPEDEWWDIGDVQVGSKTDTDQGKDLIIRFWSMVGAIFLLTFILLGGNGLGFAFAFLSTSMLLAVFYQIGPARAILLNE